MSPSDEASLDAQRSITAQRRQPPAPDYRLVIQPTGEQVWHPGLNGSRLSSPPAPSEIFVHLSDLQDPYATAPEPLSGWDFQEFLRKSLARWSGKAVTLYIISFGGMLMRTSLLDQLGPITAKPYRWQIVLATDGSDLASTAMIDKLLNSPIHEIRFYPAGLAEGVGNTRNLNAAKDLLDLRRARGQKLPVLACRVCGRATPPELAQWARQVSVDRLDLADRQTEERHLAGLLPVQAG
ncbi:MAG: hypothetical protein GXY33_12895 [Phycisphaerae bacterium]|nr:hypothetical protein [Phycisphaerae bacterium]